MNIEDIEVGREYTLQPPITPVTGGYNCLVLAVNKETEKVTVTIPGLTTMEMEIGPYYLVPKRKIAPGYE